MGRLPPWSVSACTRQARAHRAWHSSPERRAPLEAQAPERLLFQDLQLYLSNLAHQIDRGTGTGDVPLVVLLDDLSEAGSISELVNGALTCKYHKW